MENREDLVKWMAAIESDRGNEMLMNDVLGPLLEIVFLYDKSSCYNYVPGTEEDTDAGWNYFEDKFNNIYIGLNKNLYIDLKKHSQVRQVIEEIQTFVRSCSGADGLAERYLEANPILRYFTTPFQLQNEDEDAYRLAVQSGLLSYIPTEKEFRLRDRYFEVQFELSELHNFGYGENDFFMRELAYALRKLFLKALQQ